MAKRTKQAKQANPSKQKQGIQERTLATLNKRMMVATRELAEAMDDLWDRYVDPDEDRYDGDGAWTTITAGNNAHGSGRYQWGFRSEQELFNAQAECRQLACRNEFAINGHENRISYIAGTGHVYLAAAKKDRGASEENVAAVQAIVDNFVRMNRWQSRQAEIIRRMDRDGEAFLRLFVVGGEVKVRFLEPEQVRMPTHNAASFPAMAALNSFGIQTDLDDVETVLGYWVDNDFVNQMEVQHRKANVDANVKRGMPLFYPVRKNLLRAEKLLRNMSTVAEIQSAIALIRRHVNATQATISDFVAAGADAQRYSNRTGKTESIRRYPPGSILDASTGVEYDFPSAKVNSAAMVQVLQAELRAVASRLVMPEFMLTSDASNANYASTMVAEGPAVKMFERLQAETIEWDTELLWRAVEAKLGAELAAGLREVVEIQATAPTVAARDRVQETNRSQVLFNNRILSPQTWTSAEGLDYEQEQENWNQWDVEHPQQTEPIGQRTAIASDMMPGQSGPPAQPGDAGNQGQPADGNKTAGGSKDGDGSPSPPAGTEPKA